VQIDVETPRLLPVFEREIGNQAFELGGKSRTFHPFCGSSVVPWAWARLASHSKIPSNVECISHGQPSRVRESLTFQQVAALPASL
jgi:hypothetical protein